WESGPSRIEDGEVGRGLSRGRKRVRRATAHLSFRPMARSFRSDNNAGITDDALRAQADANAGNAKGYGDDEWTARARAAFEGLFGRSVDAFFVATGTAANCLALACLTRPWQRVLCHAHSHLNDDESTAPELFTSCRVTTIEPAGVERAGPFPAPVRSKLTADDVERAA